MLSTVMVHRWAQGVFIAILCAACFVFPFSGRAQSSDQCNTAVQNAELGEPGGCKESCGGGETHDVTTDLFCDGLFCCYTPTVESSQETTLPAGDDLCTQGVSEAGLGSAGKCLPSCNNVSLALVTDPPLCPSGEQCCYLDDGNTVDAACIREGMNQKGKPGVCVDNEEACAESLNVGGLCENEAQICCIPKTDATAGAGGSAAKPGAPVKLPDPLGGVTFPQFVGNVIRVFSSIAGALALLMFVYGGVMWILSGGDDSKVKSARKILMNATLGLVLIFGAYLFTSAILQSILKPS